MEMRPSDGVTAEPSEHGSSGEEGGDSKKRCCSCDCKKYWGILCNPKSKRVDELLFFIRRHIYVYVIYMLLSFYDAVVAAATGGTTNTTSYYMYAIMSYLASVVYVLYCLELVVLSRMGVPDYIVTIVFRATLCVLIILSLSLLIYASAVQLVGMLVSQYGALYIHGTCLYIWVVITRKILAGEGGSGMSEGLVNAAGGAEV